MASVGELAILKIMHPQYVNRLSQLPADQALLSAYLLLSLLLVLLLP